MTDLGEVIIENLHTLEGAFPGAQLMRAVALPSSGPSAVIMPRGFDHLKDASAPKSRPVIPAFLADIDGRAVRLEFSPAPSPDVWWLNVFSGVVSCPCCFAITGRATLPWFQRCLETAAVEEFTLASWKAGADYILTSAESARAKALFSSAERCAELQELGSFVHLAVAPRFARLVREVSSPDAVTAEKLREEMELWAGFVKRMEGWLAEADGVVPAQ
ncbi:hypothetical protein IJT17_06145 [bacterium]|nr:hypothetical protein [bacterium]